jgi:hypothetical protein
MAHNHSSRPNKLILIDFSEPSAAGTPLLKFSGASAKNKGLQQDAPYLLEIS